MSLLAKFDGQSAISGGVQLCCPWFSKHPSIPGAPSNGYARFSVWELNSVQTLPDGRTELVMTLPPVTRTGEYRYPGLCNSVRIIIGDVLDIQSTSRNDSSVDLTLSEGFHTYFQISDVANAVVTGLSGCDYIDLLSANQRCHQTGNIFFGEEVG